jgi:hypothetical protein
MNAVLKRPNPTVPTADVTERVLYVVARHELDCMREMLLPSDVPAGKILYVKYVAHTLRLAFISPTGASRSCAWHRRQVALQRLAKNRAWFFRWEGDVIGPLRLPWEEVAAYSAQGIQTRFDPTPIRMGTELVDDRLILLADSHLYPSR